MLHQIWLSKERFLWLRKWCQTRLHPFTDAIQSLSKWTPFLPNKQDTDPMFDSRLRFIRKWPNTYCCFCCWVLNNVFTIYGYGTIYRVFCTQKLAVQLFYLFKWIWERSGNVETNKQTHKNVWENQMIEICWLRLRGQVKGKIPSCFLCSNMGIMSIKFKLNVKKRTKTTNYIIMWFKLAGMEISHVCYGHSPSMSSGYTISAFTFTVKARWYRR